MRSRLAVLIVVVLLGACSATRTRPPATPAPPSGTATTTAARQALESRSSASPSPDDTLNAVLWAQRAVEHDLVYREIYRLAERELVAALADPAWDALPDNERTKDFSRLPPAVIVDVDETVLDNSAYLARLVRSGEEFAERSWTEWCKEEAARALPGALEFARFAAAHGVTMYYVTNRAEDLGAATLGNLRKVGFPARTDDVFMGLGMPVPGCQAVGTSKGCRRRLVAEHHRVLMLFGDQIVDFVDVPANTPEGREHAIEPYRSWIGQRWWVLPNAIYGSWEPAVFNDNWQLPREERRRLKMAALRTH